MIAASYGGGHDFSATFDHTLNKDMTKINPGKPIIDRHQVE